MHTKTLHDLLTGLVKHDFNSVEITQHFLSRIKPAINLTGDFDTIIEPEWNNVDFLDGKIVIIHNDNYYTKYIV